jgi:hypothetical protein
MTDPAAWIVLIMVIRWIYWSVLWWWGALFRPAAWNDNDGSGGVSALPPGVTAQVAIQPDGGLVLRIDLAAGPGWPGQVQLNGSQ